MEYEARLKAQEHNEQLLADMQRLTQRIAELETRVAEAQHELARSRLEYEQECKRHEHHILALKKEVRPARPTSPSHPASNLHL